MVDDVVFWVSVGVILVLIVAVLVVTYGVPSGLWATREPVPRSRSKIGSYGCE